MEHTPEILEQTDALQEEQKKSPVNIERPLYQRILAWLLVAVVLFAFLGTCHWLAVYGR